eukprot:g17273.t1
MEVLKGFSERTRWLYWFYLCMGGGLEATLVPKWQKYVNDHPAWDWGTNDAAYLNKVSPQRGVQDNALDWGDEDVFADDSVSNVGMPQTLFGKGQKGCGKFFPYSMKGKNKGYVSSSVSVASSGVSRMTSQHPTSSSSSKGGGTGKAGGKHSAKPFGVPASVISGLNHNKASLMGKKGLMMGKKGKMKGLGMQKGKGKHPPVSVNIRDYSTNNHTWYGQNGEQNNHYPTHNTGKGGYEQQGVDLCGGFRFYSPGQDSGFTNPFLSSGPTRGRADSDGGMSVEDWGMHHTESGGSADSDGLYDSPANKRSRRSQQPVLNVNGQVMYVNNPFFPTLSTEPGLQKKFTTPTRGHKKAPSKDKNKVKKSMDKDYSQYWGSGTASHSVSGMPAAYPKFGVPGGSSYTASGHVSSMKPPAGPPAKKASGTKSTCTPGASKNTWVDPEFMEVDNADGGAPSSSSSAMNASAILMGEFRGGDAPSSSSNESSVDASSPSSSADDQWVDWTDAEWEEYEEECRAWNCGDFEESLDNEDDSAFDAGYYEDDGFLADSPDEAGEEVGEEELEEVYDGLGARLGGNPDQFIPR